MRAIAAIALLTLMVSFTPVQAELVLTTVGMELVEDFDSYRGTGFTPTPAAGQLDSDTYRATGFSDGDMTFGGTFTTGDYARGESTGGEVSGGTYAFDVGGGDYTLGVQPTGSDFTPGALTIRVTNQTGVDLNFLQITADALLYNDADRSTTWSFGGALQDVEQAYGVLQTLESPLLADASPTWTVTPVGGLIELAQLGGPLVNNGDFFIRVAGDDLDGSGSRDEFALNNLRITGYVTAIPEPNSLALCMTLGCIPVVVSRRRRPKQA